MSGITRATEQAIGRHLFRTATFAKPTTWWIGLLLTMPANDGTGGVEPTGGAYARVQLDPSDANWGEEIVDSGMAYYNLADVVFPVPTADWGLLIGAGLWSASSGGTPSMVAALSSRFGRDFTGTYVAAGETAVKFDAGLLRFKVG